MLGYREAEQDRLQRQALELADDSAWLFRQAHLAPGDSVVEVGCGPLGCLELLAEAVGPSGSVIGVERSEDAVARAEKYVADHGLTNVEVRCGDGRATGLPRDAFDLVTSRLVLVNVPQPEELVAEAVAMAKPGGVVAYHEAVWPVHTYDPPLEAWDRLYDIVQSYADLNGIDLFIGRRVARLLREHGLADVKANAISHLYPIDHGRRMLALDFVENLSGRFLEQNLVGADELGELKAALKSHLEDPETFVISCLFVQAWGRKPL
ncbi:MAG: methyltransferase domain-containing protein [Acidimicrobiia bacterium]|nr:methyltransferase domain-containing protein [Acidimicrobiia bacterium]